MNSVADALDFTVWNRTERLLADTVDDLVDFAVHDTVRSQVAHTSQIGDQVSHAMGDEGGSITGGEVWGQWPDEIQ